MIHVFLDTETTGLGPFTSPERHDQILEIAFVWKEKGKIKYIQEFCNPGMEYLNNADEALNIQGRTTKDVLAFQDISTAAEKVKKHLSGLDNPIFHSWNIPFDRFFIEQDPWNLSLNWGEDPMVMASRYMGYSYDRIALSKAADYFEIEMPPGNFRFHTALADAYMAMKIWEVISNEKM